MQLEGESFFCIYWKINSNVYCRWRSDSVFWVKHQMFSIPKSCAWNVLRQQSHKGKYSIINGLVFIKSFEKDYNYFFISFSSSQQKVFLIFKLLNSMEGAYNNYGSYDWKHVLVSRNDYKQKKWHPAENRTHYY